MIFNTEHLETPSCPFCRQNHETEFQFPPFAVKHCKACEIRYLSPRLTEKEMTLFYQSESYFGEHSAYGEDGYASQERSLKKTFQVFLKNFKYQRLDGKMLEIGSGPGYFLQESQKYFSHQSAIEFSPTARETAQKWCHQIYDCSLENLPLENRFDAIFAHQVIEHIYYPEQFIAEIYKRLNTGGFACLSTPDAGSFWIKLLKKSWPSFKVPEHVILYTEQSLSHLLIKAGFKDVQVVKFSHAFPLKTLTRKLNLSFLGKDINSTPIWIPKTVFCVVGRK